MKAPTLQTERLVIRPFQSTDIDSLVRELTSKPDIMKNLSVECGTPTEQRKCASDFIEDYSHHWHTHDFGGWAVCARVAEIAKPGALLGYSGFEPGQLEGRGAELSYAFGEAHWGKGIATEAAKACLDWFFGVAENEQCYVCHHSWNKASKGTIDKLGFVFSSKEDLWGCVAKGDGLLSTYQLDRETYLGHSAANPT